MGLTIPSKLRDLLLNSPLETSVLGFVHAADPILLDNKTPFFPAYTDHGGEHVQRVLDDAVRLIPPELFDRTLPGATDAAMLGAADAATLTAATVLHDLGLHVREEGFLELISETTRFKPLPWFDAPQATRPADLPWFVLWERFRQEARRFTTTQVDRLLGPGNAGIPAIAYGDADRDPDSWTTPDRLLVGEFLRRHHGRLSHEIAMHGFPGAGEDYLALSRPAPLFAEAAGVVARSHAEDLRVMLAYLDYKYLGNRRPAEALLPYLMGLLRVADYLQVDAARAPTVLLRMKSPQSPQSIDEWSKHGAVAKVSWEHEDPLAVFVHVFPSHELRTHLQLGELFADLQREFDTTVAVLSEVYGRGDFEPVRLARQRLRTNLHGQSLHDELPYVPRRAALRSANDLFRLVIKDLYGDVPAVAGRELLQNAVDAVRERRRWEEQSGRKVPDARFRDLPSDVLVAIELRDEHEAVLRVSDRGVGMTPQIVIDHFLCAGSSLRPSLTQDDEVDSATAVRWIRAGRFGVGALAAFLLGPELRVTTRHVGADRGIEFVARLDDDLVRMDWADVPVGTEVSVPFVIGDGAKGYGTHSRVVEYLRVIARLYRLSDPMVAFRKVGADGTVEAIEHDGDVPLPDVAITTRWRRVDPAGFDAVLWTPSADRGGSGEQRPGPNAGNLTHNGMLIDDLRDVGRSAFSWSRDALRQLLRVPDVAVFDNRHQLGVALTRYELTSRVLPFEQDLLGSIGLDVVAWGLIVGAAAHPLAGATALRPIVGREAWLPLFPAPAPGFGGERVGVIWEHSRPWAASTSRAPEALADADWSEIPWWVELRPPPLMSVALDGLPDLGNIRMLTMLLGWTPITSVAVGTSPLRRRREPRGSPAEWTDMPAGHVKGFHRYVHRGEAPEHQAASGRLLLAAENVLLRRGGPGVVLTLLETQPAGERPDPVADAWWRLIGGPAPRDEPARHEMLRELVGQHEELRQYADAWWREFHGEPLPF